MSTIYVCGTNVTTSTAAHAWASWNNAITTSTTSTVWQQWITEQTGSITQTSPAWIQWITYDDAEREPVESEAQRVEREARAVVVRERVAAATRARIAEAKAADERAEALLLDNLTTAQRDEFKQSRCIVVRGGRSAARYRLRLGRTGNIDVIDKQGRVSHRLCAHPRDDMPDADCVLAQKLMIELAEDEFLEIANRHASFDRGALVLAAEQ